jgi:hypothetical protein
VCVLCEFGPVRVVGGPPSDLWVQPQLPWPSSKDNKLPEIEASQMAPYGSNVVHLYKGIGRHLGRRLERRVTLQPTPPVVSAETYRCRERSYYTVVCRNMTGT